MHTLFCQSHSFPSSHTKYSEFFTTDGSGSGDNDGVPSFREVILASVVIPPQVVPIVPCETTFLGELPTGSNGIAGRVYLLNRLTFAILGFSYDGQAEGMPTWWYLHIVTASVAL